MMSIGKDQETILQTGARTYLASRNDRNVVFFVGGVTGRYLHLVTDIDVYLGDGPPLFFPYAEEYLLRECIAQAKEVNVAEIPRVEVLGVVHSSRRDSNEATYCLLNWVSQVRNIIAVSRAETIVVFDAEDEQKISVCI